MEKQEVSFEPFMKFVIEFHNASLSYNRLVNKVSATDSGFNEEEIALIEEAFLVKHLAEWETFLQNIIIYCVAIDTTQISEYMDLKLAPKISFENASAIINGLSYLSITSSSELKGLAKKVIVKSKNPFEQFEISFLKQIDELYALRNYVAHKSRKSKNALIKMYRNRYNIQDFISPGFFLSQKPEEVPYPYPRSHLYYGTFMTIATLIWKYLDPSSFKFVYNDDTTKDGWLIGMVKMNKVFEKISKDFGL